MNRKQLATLCLAVIVALSLSYCASSQLPTDATWKQKAAAVCSDLDAAVLLAQIGLSYAQQSNYAFNYAPAQETLVAATQLIKSTCSTAQTEGDLLKVRNAVLMALAKAQPVLIEAMTYRGGHHRFALLLLTL